MEKLQESYLSAYVAISETLNQNSEAVNSILALKEAETDLNSLIATINSAASVNNEATNGKAETKETAKNLLAKVTFNVATALKTYAVKAKNTELKISSKVTLSGLKKMRDTDMPIKAKAILSYAQANLVNLVKYNITEMTLTNLTSLITNYELASGASNAGVGKRVASGKELDKLFTSVNSFLNETLDGLVDLTKESYPNFYDAYQTARKIKNTGLRHEKKEEESKAPVKQ
jgi:hypothetical protein